METRRVTIINSKSQSQKVIQDSKATTLGELKTEMRERGIDYEGMTFFEGHMRAELKDDAAPLPTNIPYKGQVVNDLIFMLTAPEKKVRSGAMMRVDAYKRIKEYELQDEIKRRFGKNFTQCSTCDLETVIMEVEGSLKKKSETPVAPEAPSYDACPEVSNASKALVALVEDLYDSKAVSGDTYNKVMTILKGGTYKAPEKMSKKEIDDMFDFVDR